MKIKFYGVAGLVILILFGGYGLFKYTGLWDDVSNKIPTLTTANDQQVYDPASIKGSSKFTELSTWFGIPLEDLGDAFNVPPEKLSTFSNKDLNLLYPNLDVEIGNNSVKLFVALYTNIPLALSEETYLPAQAVDILITKSKLTSQQLDYLNDHKIDVSIKNTGDDHEVGFVIKGSTTFDDLMALGFDLTAIERLLGVEIPHPKMLIKDFCIENDLEFSEVKTKLNEGMAGQQ